MKEKFVNLIGEEYSIIDLSNKLTQLDCEDICNFGNWEEILNSESVVVATDEQGEEHIQIHFEVIHKNGIDEVTEATIIKITDIEEF